jgi:hypothetical protein
MKINECNEVRWKSGEMRERERERESSPQKETTTSLDQELFWELGFELQRALGAGREINT